MKNQRMNEAALAAQLDELESALDSTLNGWRGSVNEHRAFFSTLSRDGWLKVRFCTRGYSARVQVSWFDGVRGNPVLNAECTTAAQAVRKINEFTALHEGRAV
jgi:hypothetical protein